MPINVTIFERNSYIGGRSTTVSAYNDPTLDVELGASIFVKVNHILVDAAEELGLITASARRASASVSGPTLGIWDGERFRLTQNSGLLGWFDYAKLFWKYGTAPVKTLNLMKSTVGKFLRMYDAPIFPFASLTQATIDVDLLHTTASTGEGLLAENGITGAFGREVVQASTRVNYAQNMAHIHGLEAMVCMATEGAMAVEHGNWQIFDRMVSASRATVEIGTEVREIARNAEGSYELKITSSEGAVTTHADGFDAVVLAAPYQFTGIAPLAFLPDGQIIDEIPYVTLHVTLFTSPHLLSPIFFNLPASSAVPRVVLTTLPDWEKAPSGPKSAGSPDFFSISLLETLKSPLTGGDEYLYKIFSPKPPNATFLAPLLGVPDVPPDVVDCAIADDNGSDGHATAHFTNATVTKGHISWMYRKRWHSYPYEYPRVTFEEIELAENFFYTAGMDSFISTMETNALMGKNVAALLVEKWKGKRYSGQTTDHKNGQQGADVHGKNDL